MAVKSVIDIEVNDEKFKSFKALYDDYKNALGETPDAWKNANAEMSGGVDAAGELASHANDALDALRGQVDANKQLENTEKKRADNEKKLEAERKKNAENRKKSDIDTAKRWKEIGGLVAHAGLQLTKFAAIGAGLAAGTGAFGMNKLANDASQTRFQAMGLGINAGAMHAANINYQSLLSTPSQSIAAVRDAQSDVTKQWSFGAMGIQDYQGKTASDLLPEILRASRKIAKEAPEGQLNQVAQAYGVSNYVSSEDLMRMKQMSDQEFDAMLRKAQQDQKNLAINDSTLKSYQDLQKQWDRFSQEMENTWLKGLEPLAPVLTKFSEAVNDAFKTIMESGKLEPIIKKVGDGLTKFSKYLVSDEFQHDVDGFMHGLDVAGGYIYSFAKGMGVVAASLGFGSEKTLTGSQYRQIDALPPELAKAVTDALENPSKQGDLDVYQGLAEKAEAASKIDKDTYAKLKQLGLDIGKPMSVEEYKKAQTEDRKQFINEQVGAFKLMFSDASSAVGGAVSGVASAGAGLVSDFQQAREINEAYTPMGEAKIGGNQKQMMTNVYDAYRKAGFSDKQAKVMTAEVGRENDYSEKLIFGTHIDPHNKAVNLGMISMQGNRGTALAKYMTERGLMKNGKMEHSQAAIDAMAAFQMQEMQSGGFKMGEFLADKDISYQKGSALAGRNYVKWRYDDPKYASHKTREAGYYAAINKISRSDYAGTPFVTKKDDSGELITVKDSYARKPTQQQAKSIMFQQQQGAYDLQQGRGMRVEINNATGGNVITSAASL